MGNKHYPYLDGIRGIAAIAVVFHHASQILNGYSALPSAHLAVDLFFCLSGFVVARAYEHRLDHGLSASAFVRIRLIRLGPLLLLGAALGFASAVITFRDVGAHPFARALIADVPAFVMIPSGLLLHQEPFPTNPPMWSLFFELLANLAFAFPLLRKVLSRLVAVAMMAACLAVAAWWFSDVDAIGHTSLPPFVAGLFRVGFAFFAGVVIFHLVAGGKLPRWTGKQSTTIAAVSAMTAILLLPASAWWSDLILIFAAIPVTIAASTSGAGKIGRSACKLLGEISYPIYLIHYPILYGLLSKGFIRQAAFTHQASFYTIAIAGLVMLSVLLSRLYDVPFRNILSAKTIG